MSRQKRKLPKPIAVSEWLQIVEKLIQKHTTPPRTRGKYKGHGDTDAVAWATKLVSLAQADIKRTRRGIGYDENMALASLLGLIFSAWYANVHRAKCLDPNRPLHLRRRALRVRQKWLLAYVDALTSDEMMAITWSHQEFNIPYGKKARGGKFV